jgi:hypothetical protein
MLLDGDAFILQVQGVLTRIRWGAILVMDDDDASRSILLSGATTSEVVQEKTQEEIYSSDCY